MQAENGKKQIKRAHFAHSASIAVFILTFVLSVTHWAVYRKPLTTQLLRGERVVFGEATLWPPVRT